MALKIPRPSPKVIVPKQSLEISRPVLPSAVYSMSFPYKFVVLLPAGGIAVSCPTPTQIRAWLHLFIGLQAAGDNNPETRKALAPSFRERPTPFTILV